jgi:hypothetical protein
MFAFFGLGLQEILLLALLGGVVVIIAFVVLVASKSSSGQSSNRVAELENENQRLRGQINERRDAKD